MRLNIVSQLSGVLLAGAVLAAQFISPAHSAGGTPDAVNDSVVMYEDSGPIVINWIANDDMDDNAALDSFDATSTNSGSVSDNGDGTFNFTPAAGYSGGDGFTYTICDDDTPTAECDTASVSITIVATSACLTGFYQTLSGEINILDTTTTPASYVSAATDIGELNATGYNPNDGLIYGFSSNLDKIVSFDPNTSTFDLDVFDHTEDNPFAGDFDSSNNLYYNTSSSTTLYVYSSSTDSRSTITLPSSHGVADFAYVPSNDLFYGVQSGGTNMAIIDVSPASVTTLALSGPITGETGGFGAAWVTGNTNLFVFNNDSGNIFSIDTGTGASTLVGTSAPNGSNDGMSCAAGSDPFNISTILDYGDAPDTYSTLDASSGASAVVNTSYRIGNFNEIDADGQPGATADADDLDDIGDDEDGVRIGVDSLENAVVYEGESNTVSVDVPLDNGYVSLWIDQNNDGDFDVAEQFATDVSPSSGVASLVFTPPNTTSSTINTYARVRLAARTGGGATGLFSFGEIEDYQLQLNPSRPTITNDALSTVTAANAGAYNITGTCTDDGDTVDVAVDDGSTTVNATTTSCSGGTFSVVVDISGLNDGTVTVTSTIDDGVNATVNDVDAISKDADGPSINQSSQAAISNANQASYPVAGTCSADGDTITVTLTDSDSPANQVSTGTTCSSGTYSVMLNASGLIDGMVNVESEIDDGTNPAVTDDEDVTMDTGLPTIDQSALTTITGDNAASFPVSGTCDAVGDTITVTASDSDSPANAVADNTTCQAGGVYAVTLDMSELIAGNIFVLSQINDGVNPIVSDDENTTMPSDLDDDDTTSEEEMGGPNDGDGNNDGTPDHLQDEVTTKINPVVGEYTTTEAAGDCTEFNAVNFFDESDLGVADDEYDYDIGLHGFEIDCSGVGGTVNITFYWDQEYDTSDWIYRKYNSTTDEYVDFSDNVTYATANVGGNAVTTVSFSITDGGPFDADGVANGTIVDPAGPAVLGTLSDTGAPATYAPLAGVSLISIALLISYQATKKRRQSTAQ